MLGIDHPSKLQPPQRTTTPLSTTDRSSARQSWSSDERAHSSAVSISSTTGSGGNGSGGNGSGSSAHSKEPKSLWGRLRRQTSKLHIGGHSHHFNHTSAPSTPRISTPGPSTSSASLPLAAGRQGSPKPHADALAHASSGVMKSGTLASSSASLSLPTPRSSTSEPPSSRGSHTQHSSLVFSSSSLNLPAAPATDAVPGATRRGTSSTNHLAESKPRSSALFSHSRTFPTRPPLADTKTQASVTRTSVDVYRTSAGGYIHNKQHATPSYSMDIPRSRASADAMESDYVSAESIKRSLSGYTGNMDVKGKPRLRRLMTMPRIHKHPNPKDMMGMVTEPPGMGLECIAEDESEEFQADSAHNGQKSPVFAGNLGPPEEAVECNPPRTSLSMRNRPATSSMATRASPLPGQTADATTGNIPGSWWVSSKRFSENSGTTVSSGDTLDASNEHDGKGIEKRPSTRPSTNHGPNVIYHTTQYPTKPPTTRPPRLSFSNVPRPGAMYEEYTNIIPSPTKENPPKLAPMVHGQAAAADKDLAMDPAVYRNTFFNARPANEQTKIKEQILSSAKGNGSGSKALYRAASDDTLNGSSNKPEDNVAENGRHVRFTDVCDIITNGMYYEAEADEQPAEMSAAHQPAAAQMSLVPVASGAAGIAEQQPHVLPPAVKVGPDPAAAAAPATTSYLEPESPVVTSPASADTNNTVTPLTATANTDNHPLQPIPEEAASSDAAEEIKRLNMELEALKRTVRSLQSHNDMLTELAMRDPLEDIPEEAKLHIRTIELENTWLRKELSQLKQRGHV
ncbi:hypothetical protein GQ54DRAFT_311477 [Martensiomyces pterosporus]|nr:hypothetical protein GQ54DRAFT_311477 [Martensiomyces pterosporus]